MSDIVKAMAKEQEYLEYRKKGEEPFHLVDAMKELGFESLEEYFKTKAKHELKAMNFKLINASSPQSCVQDIFNVIFNKENAVIFVNIDHVLVWTQVNSSCNDEYCTAQHIPIVPVGANGTGTLVSTPGDFGIGICFPKKESMNLALIVNGFIDIFRKYTDKELTNQGNDIMYDGKKVCGFTWYNKNDMFMVISPMSFSEKSELVSNICTNKPQIKQVGYIDFMDRDTLKQEVTEWLQIRELST